MPFCRKASAIRSQGAHILLCVCCFGFWWRRPIHSKGARTAAASTSIGPRARLVCGHEFFVCVERLFTLAAQRMRSPKKHARAPTHRGSEGGLAAAA
jgi:hypothetical protein